MIQFFITTISLFFTLSTFSQDCLVKRSNDPYTKEIRLSSGFIQLDGGSITIDADSKEIDILFSIEGVDKCYDNNSIAYIFFEGSKSRGSTRNGGSMNCEGLFHFIFRNNAHTISLLQRMSTQKITHIIFTGNNKKETTVTLGPLEQEAVMNFTACVVTEAKTLIK